MKVQVAIDKHEPLPDEPLPEPPPLNHDIDYVMATWTQLRIHHVYPRAGGYDDQDELLMQDWHTMNLFYNRVESGQLTTFDMSQFRTSSRSWSDMAGE